MLMDLWILKNTLCGFIGYPNLAPTQTPLFFTVYGLIIH